MQVLTLCASIGFALGTRGAAQEERHALAMLGARRRVEQIQKKGMSSVVHSQLAAASAGIPCRRSGRQTG